MNRTISLPEELLKRAEELAAREQVPVEFLSAKLSEQLSDLTPDQALAMIEKFCKDHLEKWSLPLGRRCGARVFEVRPKRFFPYDAWVARNPELWNSCKQQLWRERTGVGRDRDHVVFRQLLRHLFHLCGGRTGGGAGLKVEELSNDIDGMNSGEPGHVTQSL